MTALSSHSVEIMAGIKLFKFVDVDDIESMPDWELNITTAIGLKSGITLTEGHQFSKTAELKHSQEEGSNGVSYRSELAFTMPGNNSSLMTQFQLMKQKRFIVLATDYDDNTYIIGEKLKDGSVLGAKFNHSFKSGQLGGQKNNECAFSLNTPNTLAFYSI